MNLVVVTEIIAPYRIPVFNALSRCSEMNLHVMFLSETDPTLRQWPVYKDEIKFSWEVLPSWRWRLGEYNVLVNRGISRALSKATPGVILCGGYSYLASWQAMRWARTHQVPFLVWVESTSSDERSEHGAVEFLKRRFLRDVTGFVVPGRSSSEYVKQLGASRDRIEVAPNAVDVEFFSHHAHLARENAESSRRTLGLPERYALFVGRLVRQKGVYDLLDAYARLSPEVRSDLALVLVGDGADRTELAQRAQAIVPGKVLFPGFAHREQLAAFYALSDMLVFPTLSDPWGLVVNEAMSCGVPVIASDVAGCTADLVEDGGNGRVVRAGGVEQLAQAMSELASNREMRLQMGLRSREIIEGFTPEACACGIAQAAQRWAR
jgi:glycosyltransferase involved in cell wall biosynthesis